MENEEQLEKNNNPNWQYVGKLKDISILSILDKTLFLIKTNTTAFLAESTVLNPLHFGQTVKLSKRDNTVKIGTQILQRIEVEYKED